MKSQAGPDPPKRPNIGFAEITRNTKVPCIPRLNNSFARTVSTLVAGTKGWAVTRAGRDPEATCAGNGADVAEVSPYEHTPKFARLQNVSITADYSKVHRRPGDRGGGQIG